MYSVKKVFSKISQNSQENTCARVSFLIKLQALPPTLLKKRLWYRRFLVNFAKFLITPFLQNTSGWLLLYLPCYLLKIKTCFNNTLSFKFSGKLSNHTLTRIINENLAENIKLVLWKKMCFTLVTRFVYL